MEEHCNKADTFKPERWLKPSQGGTGEYIHPFASLPYGYGARMCLGRRFADLEMQILLAKVMFFAFLCTKFEPLIKHVISLYFCSYYERIN